jgi:sulfur carrier protein ThiS
MKEVEVRLYSSLRKYYTNHGNSEALVVGLSNQADLRELLIKLKIPEGEVAVVMVNGKPEKESYLLQDRDRVGLFPLIGGG